MKKSSILLMIVMMTIRFVMAQQDSNLVRNGTFEEGNVGFQSDCRFESQWDLNDSPEPGAYTFRSPSNPLDSFSHSSLLIDVRDSGIHRLWYDSITIKPNTSYSFSCIVYNYFVVRRSSDGRLNNCGVMKLCVNGKKVSRILNLPNTHEWRTLNGKFTSGPDQNRIEISIKDAMVSKWGNIVMIDNVVFKEIQPGELAKKEKRFPKLGDKGGFAGAEIVLGSRTYLAKIPVQPAEISPVKKKESVVKTPPVKEGEPVVEISPVKFKAQSTCSGSLGSPIFFENFGKQASCYSSTPLTTGTTNYNFKGIGPGPQRNPPGDGEYVIWCGSSAGAGFDLWHQKYHDHTTGTGSGAGSNMAIFNAAFEPGDFYRRTISGLCENTNYTLSIYVANMHKPASGSIKPNLTFKIFNSGTTTLLASSNTGEIPSSSSFTWLYYDFSFTTGPGQTSVDAVLQNLAQGGFGNDLALDDISVRPCGPSLTISLSPGSSVSVGTSVTFNGTLGASYTSPVYQWQSSTDGTTWTDIAGATSINHTIPNTVVTDSKQYRLLSAENGNLSNANCRIYSNVVSLTVNEIMPKIFFDNDKAELRQESKEELDKLYSILKRKPDFFIQVSGHTDNNASHEYNYVLSEARAVAVVQYLIDKGLDKNKFIAKGFGDTKPIASNEDEAGRQQNRRIEFMILDPQNDTDSKHLSLQDSSIIRLGDKKYVKKATEIEILPVKQKDQSALAQQDSNLVQNGTFEMDLTGFKTDYNLREGYTNPGEFDVTDDVTYYVAEGGFNNPLPFTGKFLYIDAFEYPNTSGTVKIKRCWYNSVSVKPNTTYVFSCSVASVLKRLTPQLKFNVNGNGISDTFYVFDNNWQTISAKYTTKSEQTRIEISIVGVNKESDFGNDFAIDNIFFGPEKETPSVIEEKQEIEIPPVKLDTQSTCRGSLGSPIFFENFGTPRTCYSDSSLSAGTTNYAFRNAANGIRKDYGSPPEDGEYVIWCGSSAGTSFGFWHQIYYDHTTGTGSGTGSNMAIFNGSFTPGEFYRKSVAGLCPNTNYTFSIYVANLSKLGNEVDACWYAGGVCIKPNLTFKIFNSGTTTLLASSNTGEIPLSSRFTWRYYDFSFTTGAGQTSVDVVLQNLAQGGCGNDLALDDISVRPCGPSLTISLSPGSSVNAGTSVTFNGILGAGYTSPVYQWQSSTDGTSWTDIVGATSIDYTISSTVITDSKQYRLLSAENGNISNTNCKINSNAVTLTVMPKIFFDNDKAELRQESKEELDKLYSILKRKPDFFIQVSGHTDNNASHEYNYVLSEARAVAVVQYLIDKGLDKNKFIAKGFGDTKPIASNEDEAGRQQNRRIEFMILDPQNDTDSKHLSLQDSSIIRPGDEKYDLLRDDFKTFYLKRKLIKLRR